MDHMAQDIDRYPALRPIAEDERNSPAKKKRSSFTNLFGISSSHTSGNGHGRTSFLTIKNDEDRMFYVKDILQVCPPFMVCLIA